MARSACLALAKYSNWRTSASSQLELRQSSLGQARVSTGGGHSTPALTTAALPILIQSKFYIIIARIEHEP